MGVGYSVLQCKSVMGPAPPSSRIVSASSISLIMLMPVERITGFLVAAIFSKYGRLVISPLGTFHMGVPSCCRKSMLSKSNGVDRYAMPMESQYSFSCACSSNVRWMRLHISSWLSASPVSAF